jgi:hypothetical protein
VAPSTQTQVSDDVGLDLVSSVFDQEITDSLSTESIGRICDDLADEL